MRKLVSWVLVFLLLVSCAVAEGKLSVVSKNLIEFDADDTGYFFAKIENIGDAPIGVGKGKLVAFSADDEILVSSEYISSYPNYTLLDPAESVYVREFIWEQTLTDNDIVDYKFSVPPYEHATKSISIPCEAYYELKGDYDNYVYVTFTNPSNEIQYNYFVTVALWDVEGNLIFVDGGYADAIGIHPGSTITRKIYIDYDFIKHFNAHGIEIGSVDATVSCKVE